MDGNSCVLYKPKYGGCSALNPIYAKQYETEGKCGTIGCPFFKPTRNCLRIGERFVEYKPVNWWER